MSPIVRVYAGLTSDPHWMGSGPVQDPARVEHALGRALPDDLRWLYGRIAGAEWSGRRVATLYSPGRAIQVNTGLFHDYLPEMLAIGTDGGPNIYFLDPDGLLGRGAGAVWQVPAGVLGRDMSRFVATDLAGFLQGLIDAG